MSTDHCAARLQKTRQVSVVYSNGSAERVLTELDDSQRVLAQTLGLFDLARQMGNIVIN
jgi:hypothetical protein